MDDLKNIKSELRSVQLAVNEIIKEFESRYGCVVNIEDDRVVQHFINEETQTLGSFKLSINISITGDYKNE